MGSSRRLIAGALAVLLALVPGVPALAQNSNESFSLQATPSPLVTSMKPGESKTLELAIQNTGNASEDLRIGLRAFRSNPDDGAVEIEDEAPGGIEDWVEFSDPTFSVEPNESFTQQIKINMPEESGFSYSFAILITRQDVPIPKVGETLIQGALAIFALISVDKPGAVRTMDLVDVTTDRSSYEYLPSDIKIKLRNTGNTLLQPYGNVYIQRGTGPEEPITVLPLNDADTIILPETAKELVVNWNEGFPRFDQVKTADNASAERKLVWDWGKLQNFRIGRYTAKVVAVYNDGQRDIPIEASTQFWVIPWKLLLGALVLFLLLGAGVYTVLRHFFKGVRKIKKSASKQED